MNARGEFILSPFRILVAYLLGYRGPDEQRFCCSYTCLAATEVFFHYLIP